MKDRIRSILPLIKSTLFIEGKKRKSIMYVYRYEE